MKSCKRLTQADRFKLFPQDMKYLLHFRISYYTYNYSIIVIVIAKESVIILLVTFGVYATSLQRFL